MDGLEYKYQGGHSVDAYYCLDGQGHGDQPRECKDVRCDECPNRDKIIPKRPAAEDAGWSTPKEWWYVEQGLVVRPD
jgi:hypothetical protein